MTIEKHPASHNGLGRPPRSTRTIARGPTTGFGRCGKEGVGRSLEEPLPQPLPEAGRGENLLLPSPLRGGAGGGVFGLRAIHFPSIITTVSPKHKPPAPP